MTLPATRLVVVGNAPTGVAAAWAWLSAALGGADAGHHAAAIQHVVLVVSVEHHAHLLSGLPAALGLPTPGHWPQALVEGMHPLALGHVNCVVCIGPPDAVLPECVCQANHVWVGSDVTTSRLPGWVARLCGPHARLTWETPPQASEHAVWLAAGFLPVDTGSFAPHQASQAVYAPRWPVPPLPTLAASQAVVIGAGLAGAAVTWCLIRAGWQVCLIDQHAQPAQGASGLPVGMLSAHVTAQDTLLSALSRTGMPLHLRELLAHVPEGHGWQRTHVTNLRGADTDADTDPDAGNVAPGADACTLPAALVRPAALVDAWLRDAHRSGRLTTLWSTTVSKLAAGVDAHGHTAWQVQAVSGKVLACAPHLVVAAAYGTAALLAPHVADMTDTAPLRAVKGQMTLAPLHGTPLAPHAMRQQGVFVPAYDDADHPIAPRIWAMGSTYERGQHNTAVTAAAHARNAASLAAMHPAAHARLQQQAALGETVEWAQVRCASLDRLPLVGALPAVGSMDPGLSLARVPRVPGLWTVSALGSRGLTLAMLAAQLLVARMQGAPLPVTKRHAAALDPARFALKNARKHAGKAPAPAHCANA